MKMMCALQLPNETNLPPQDRLDMVRHQAVGPDFRFSFSGKLSHESDVVAIIVLTKNVFWRRLPRWVTWWRYPGMTTRPILAIICLLCGSGHHATAGGSMEIGILSPELPSRPEANPLQQKAGYMYATFLCRSVKLAPCKAGRTIYVPGTPRLAESLAGLR